jgi:hypothetical protein
MHNCYEYGSQEVTKSTKITSNKVEVNSLNPPSPLVWTYQKKKKKIVTNLNSSWAINLGFAMDKMMLPVHGMCPKTS